MKAAIDKAGRVVIPKPIRDALGLVAGTEVDVVIDGVSIRIDGPEPVEPEIELVDGWFAVIKGGGGSSDVVEEVHRLREERLDYLESLGRDD